MVVGRLGALLPRHAPSLARLKPWVFEEPGGRAALGERRETGEGGLSAIRSVRAMPDRSASQEVWHALIGVRTRRNNG